jgi:LysM repeat protein
LTPVDPETLVTDNTQGQGGGETTYTVQEGDSYGSIALQFGVSVPELLQYNNITGPSFNPVPGTTLLIPTDADTSEFGTGGGGGGVTLSPNSYVMQPNDNLDGIAQQFDVSYEVLLAVNGIEPGTILPAGTVLVIPQGAPPYGVFPPVDENGNVILEGVGGGGGSDIYIMQPGDTLDGVAQQFNVSLISLLQANGLEDGANVPPGTVISIPLDAPEYGVTPPLFTAQGEAIPAGTVVEDPASTDTTQGQGGGEVTPEVAEEPEIYIVEPNDNLTRIARDHDVSVDCLIDANNIVNPDLIYAGQELTIPANCPAFEAEG